MAASRPARSSIKEAKTKALDRQLAALLSDYQAVTEQSTNVLDAGQRNKLLRQMKFIEEQMVEREAKKAALEA